MTDRELLEKAAKAAGIDLAHRYYIPTYGAVLTAAGYGMRPWNPLTDDGDAFRLAVKLRLEIRHGVWEITVAGNGAFAEVSRDGNDDAAATRRAIVRAAAAMEGE